MTRKDTESQNRLFVGIKLMIVKGDIKCYSEIFSICPKKRFRAEMKMTPYRFIKTNKSPNLLTEEEIKRIAQLIDIPVKTVRTLIINQCRKNPRP